MWNLPTPLRLKLSIELINLICFEIVTISKLAEHFLVGNNSVVIILAMEIYICAAMWFVSSSAVFFVCHFLSIAY